MQELYYFLSIIFFIIFWYISYQDYKTKNIYLWSFYLLVLISLLYIFYIDHTGYAKYLLLFYFMIIIILDILDYFWRLPNFINDGWMIGNTWIYDYWIYIFILVLFIDFLPLNFLYYYIWFTLSLIFGGLVWYIITKKKYSKQVPLFVYWFFIILFMLFTIFILK